MVSGFPAGTAAVPAALHERRRRNAHVSKTDSPAEVRIPIVSSPSLVKSGRDGRGPGGGTRGKKTRLAALFVVAAALALPVFAHGCHGDDADLEPGVGPPTQPDRPAAAGRNTFP